MIKVLFLGDIFGDSGIKMVAKHLPQLIAKHNIDFTIAQSENAAGRKGFTQNQYNLLKSIGVNAFTLGNHVWAKDAIASIIENDDIIRPFNVNDNTYSGAGTRVFEVKNKKIRVSQFMGITFNELFSPWKQTFANNFFDAFDQMETDHDFHIIDFHAETTSEKNVFSLYVDGKVSAFIGTHTHVQTADQRTLPKGTAYITDVGMVGPYNSAIGADFQSVYKKMRYGDRVKFKTSKQKAILNAVVITLIQDGPQKIELISIS